MRWHGIAVGFNASKSGNQENQEELNTDYPYRHMIPPAQGVPRSHSHHVHHHIARPASKIVPLVKRCRAYNVDTLEDTTLLPNRRDVAILLALVTGLPSSPACAGPPQDVPPLRHLTEEEKEQLNRTFATTLPKAKAPVMLRLAFHDAGTYDRSSFSGGANASIRFELDRPENAGLKRGWNVIEATMQRLKGTEVGSSVSAADLIALAGAYAVKITGGPEIWPQVGRVDAEGPDPEGRLPLETFSAEEQRSAFGAKGLSVTEMVALLGSHTLGGKGFGDPLTFDNTYYVSLLQKPWEKRDDPMAKMIGLESDHVLADDVVCRPIIEKYAEDQAAFYSDFGDAYLKLSRLGTVR